MSHRRFVPAPQVTEHKGRFKPSQEVTHPPKTHMAIENHRVLTGNTSTQMVGIVHCHHCHSLICTNLNPKINSKGKTPSSKIPLKPTSIPSHSKHFHGIKHQTDLKGLSLKWSNSLGDLEVEQLCIVVSVTSYLQIDPLE